MKEGLVVNSIWHRRVSKWDISDMDKIFIIKFIDDLEEGRITGKKYSMASILSSICNLKMCLNHFEKPFSDLISSDIELFIQSLQSGDTKKNDGEPYNEFSVREMSRLLRSYHKWKSKNGH